MWKGVQQTRRGLHAEGKMTMTLAKLSPRKGGGLNFIGNLVKVRMSADDGNDGISILEHRMAKGEAPPLHIHRHEDEIFHLMEGCMRFEVDGKTIVAESGDTVLAPKGIPHRFIVESEEGARCLTIMTGHDFGSLVRDISPVFDSEDLPPAVAPTPAMIEKLVAAAAQNNIDIVGPPLA